MPTPPTTSNHGLPLIPAIGETNASDYEDAWGTLLNDEAWSVLDEKLVARDTIANQSNYTAYQDALFRATDTGELYYGDGTSWILADGEFDALTASTLSVSTAPSNSTDVARKSEIDSLDTSKLEASNYTPITDVDGEISVSATSVSGLDSAVDSNDTDISNLQSNKLDSSNYNPESDTHTKYTDSNAVSAIESTSGLNLSAGLDLNGDLSDGTTTIWDSSAGSILSSSLEADSVSVAGRSVSLGGSTNIAHSDLTSISEDQHHSKSHDHSEADITTVPNTGLTNSSVTVAGNAISLGGSSAIAHADLSSVSSDQHHSKSHDHSEQGITTVGNQGLTNYQVTVAGNTVALGASTGISHADLGSITAGDHHTAHEHPGDQAASSNLNMSSNAIDNVSDITGQYATHGFGGSSYNIDLTDSTTDARYRDTNTNTIIWFREGGNVEVPNGQLSEKGNRVATRTYADSNYVNDTGDSMSGRLSMGTSDLYFQPGSSGGSVTGLTFESNTNAGSDFGYVEYHDDYFNGGEESALVLRTENDSTDKVVLDGAGGTLVERGGLQVNSGDVSIQNGGVVMGSFRVEENNSTNSLDFNYTGA